LLEKLLDVTPIPYSLEHGIEITHPLLDSDCPGHVSLSTLSGDCRIATEFLFIEDIEKRSEFSPDSEDKPPLSYCLWLSTETVFESLLGSVSMTVELPSFPEDLCALLNDNLPTPLTLFSLLGRHPILLGRHLCKESVCILGHSEVHLSKGWTSVTTTEDEAVVWEEQEYRPPTFE
jgi:hypothetical protein